jgi:hypothetical protein
VGAGVNSAGAVDATQAASRDTWHPGLAFGRVGERANETGLQRDEMVGDGCHGGSSRSNQYVCSDKT